MQCLVNWIHQRAAYLAPLWEYTRKVFSHTHCINCKYISLFYNLLIVRLEIACKAII